MGYTPYSLEIIDTTTTPTLIKANNTIVIIGNTTNPGIVSGKDYTILQITNGNPASYSTITIDNTTGVITTTADTQVGIYTIYLRSTGSYNTTSVVLTVSNGGPIPCLTEDTMVLTSNGYKNVKELNKDDYVITGDNRKVVIKDIFYTIVQGNKNTYPYIIPKNSIANNYPKVETRISGHHLIKYGDKWIHPIYSKMFQQDTNEKVIKYYHIELENYETDHLVINDGFVVESFAGYNNRHNNIVNKQRINRYYRVISRENVNRQRMNTNTINRSIMNMQRMKGINKINRVMNHHETFENNKKIWKVKI
jgi:hypothetical protein